MKATIRTIKGGVTAAKGFEAAGAHVGLKRKRKDLALIKSDFNAVMAGTFTQNTAKAPPVLWNKNILDSGQTVKAIVINSGNANSCTGKEGHVHAQVMAKTTAQCLGLSETEVLVSSTGIIGVPLPIDTVVAGIETVSTQLGPDRQSGLKAAEAIMTTDAFVKEIAVQFEIDGKTITLGAMAKGSGMVHPNMATMLAFITTDLNITRELLQKAVSESVDKTYNMISVDGDSSTNDMMIALANGAMANKIVDTEDTNYHLFASALNFVNEYLAKSIAKDGEGANKLLEVEVSGAKTLLEARALSRAVISSNLVKTAFFASDPNWGRIVAALGSTGVPFDINHLNIAIEGGVEFGYLLKEGSPVWIEESLARKILMAEKVTIKIEIEEGTQSAKAWGCDLTHQYIERTCRYKSDHVIADLASVSGGVA